MFPKWQFGNGITVRGRRPWEDDYQTPKNPVFGRARGEDSRSIPSERI